MGKYRAHLVRERRTEERRGQPPATGEWRLGDDGGREPGAEAIECSVIMEVVEGTPKCVTGCGAAMKVGKSLTRTQKIATGRILMARRGMK